LHSVARRAAGLKKEKILATPLVSALAKRSSHDLAERLTHVHLRARSALSSDNNFLCQAAWMLAGGNSPVADVLHPVSSSEISELIEWVEHTLLLVLIPTSLYIRKAKIYIRPGFPSPRVGVRAFYLFPYRQIPQRSVRTLPSCSLTAPLSKGDNFGPQRWLHRTRLAAPNQLGPGFTCEFCKVILESRIRQEGLQ
jgi:hypothetical protein